MQRIISIRIWCRPTALCVYSSCHICRLCFVNLFPASSENSSGYSHHQNIMGSYKFVVSILDSHLFRVFNTMGNLHILYLGCHICRDFSLSILGICKLCFHSPGGKEVIWDRWLRSYCRGNFRRISHKYSCSFCREYSPSIRLYGISHSMYRNNQKCLPFQSETFKVFRHLTT